MKEQKPSVVDLGNKTLGDVLMLALPPHVSPLLDIGCGSGDIIRAYARAGTPAAVGLDIKSVFAPLLPHSSGELFVQADSRALPFMDETFSAVLMVNSLHHIPYVDHPLLISEVRRVLAKYGTLCVIEARCTGPAYEVTRMIDDENDVAAQAQLTLSQMNHTRWAATQFMDFTDKWRVSDIDTLSAHYHKCKGHLQIITEKRTEIDNLLARLTRCEDGPGVGIDANLRLRAFRKLA
ncbi:class I SAM-dependent methyltransferase [Rhizobium ruizarguesonis]|uniref:class I SAM-dependent methyltransferase n=1 Tax=Rhizobium ruizarguesonis TaxID=2081791 RepID=UPI0010301570|nr:class I SAM-dependent methyltransferase [Rhizobium ruizarguesonis]TBA11988.1 class I SAM-dependent methyltransferase [Rhizobium ruizarguesonis]